MKKRRLSTLIKQGLRKVKYMDKTQSRYFAVMSFLIGFCLFTGTTYSYFTFVKHLNAATITIARLNYNLASPNASFNSTTHTISVPGKASTDADSNIVTLDLNLGSANDISTQYALNYACTNTNVKVYYSQSVTNNTSGVISAKGNIVVRVVIENPTTSAVNVTFNVNGGYLQNDKLTSNITQGYYEADIVVRAIQLDENFQNGVVLGNFPAKSSEYRYYKTQCTSDVTATYNENATGDEKRLLIENFGERSSCDVYFKKQKVTTGDEGNVIEDIEVIYVLQKKDGSTEYVTSVAKSDAYTPSKAECSDGSTATLVEGVAADGTTAVWKMDISGVQKQAICTGYFTEN